MSYCAPCARSFVNETALNQHLANSSLHKLHPSVSSLRCPICQRLFSGEKALMDHRIQYYSSSCSNQRVLDSYTNLGSPAQPLFYCIHCDMPSSSQEALEKHISFFHALPCNNCGELLPDSNALSQHMDFAHPTYEFPCYTCNPSCRRSFDTQEALQTHLQFMIEKHRLSLARHTKNRWSVLQETPAAIEKLRSMTHTKEVLAKNNYVLEPHTEESVNGQRKCLNCRG